jgi:hypothetical protein
MHAPVVSRDGLRGGIHSQPNRANELSANGRPDVMWGGRLRYPPHTVEDRSL